MNHDRGLQSVRWASLAIAAGGLLVALLWIAFTIVHGPTSFDREGFVLGRSTLFWGRMLGGPPNLLVALGLIILYPLLANRARRLTRVGYTLTMIGLVVPAGVDLFVWRALGPPFFVPVVALGLILLALGSQHSQRIQKRTLDLLMLIGILQAIAFALVLIPLEIADQVGSYRIFGLFDHFLTGLGWAVFGVGYWTRQAPQAFEPA